MTWVSRLINDHCFFFVREGDQITHMYLHTNNEMLYVVPMNLWLLTHSLWLWKEVLKLIMIQYSGRNTIGMFRIIQQTGIQVTTRIYITTNNWLNWNLFFCVYWNFISFTLEQKTMFHHSNLVFLTLLNWAHSFQH